MTTSRFRYSLYLLTTDGNLLGQVAVLPDWETACQGAAWAGMRTGCLPMVSSPAEETFIEPLWDTARGAPFATGFAVRIPANGHGDLTTEFPLEYFRPLAQQAADIFVEKKMLSPGDLFNFGLLAQPDDAALVGQEKTAFDVAETSAGLPYLTSRIAAYQARCSTPVRAGQQFPEVFMLRSVLDECLQATREVGACETGGILIGRLHRDETINDIFIEVTAQIPATLAQGQLASLTFTAETWTAVQAAIHLRKSDEIQLGWWHSHPGDIFKKKDEPAGDVAPAKQGVNTVFFSANDIALTRTCFPAAYSQSLVIGEDASGRQAWGMYGWIHGQLAKRDFHLMAAATVTENSKMEALT